MRAGVSAAVITAGSAFLMFLLEHASNDLYATPWDSMWWSFATMTTTGYGDVVPRSFGGRVLGVFTMFGGVGLLSVLTALIASAFVTESLKEARGLEAIRGRGHIIVAGWNLGAEAVIEGIAALSDSRAAHIVLVSQLPEEAVNEILYKYRDLEIQFVRGDYTQETVLARANVRGAAAAIILADSSSSTSTRADERTVLACLAMKHLNPDVQVIGELLEAQNEVHLRRANADDVVMSGEFNAFLLATAAATPGIPQAVRALLAPDAPTQIRKRAIPDQFIGRTFGEMASHLREEQGVLAIGVATETKGLTLADVLSADYTSVDEFIQRKFDEAGIEVSGLARVGVQINPKDSYVIGPNDTAIVIDEGA